MQRKMRERHEGRYLAGTVLTAALITIIVLVSSPLWANDEPRRPAIEWSQATVVTREAQRVIDTRRADLTARLTAYMTRAGHVQGLIDLAPLMVELSEQTGNDCRICPVTCTAESSGGRVCCGSHNPFGALGMSFDSWESAVRYYFRRITEYGYNGCVWSIAWYWYMGGSDTPAARSYANNITKAVQSY